MGGEKGTTFPLCRLGFCNRWTEDQKENKRHLPLLLFQRWIVGMNGLEEEERMKLPLLLLLPSFLPLVSPPPFQITKCAPFDGEGREDESLYSIYRANEWIRRRGTEGRMKHLLLLPLLSPPPFQITNCAPFDGEGREDESLFLFIEHSHWQVGRWEKHAICATNFYCFPVHFYLSPSIAFFGSLPFLLPTIDWMLPLRGPPGVPINSSLARKLPDRIILLQASDIFTVTSDSGTPLWLIKKSKRI